MGFLGVHDFVFNPYFCPPELWLDFTLVILTLPCISSNPLTTQPVHPTLFMSCSTASSQHLSTSMIHSRLLLLNNLFGKRDCLLSVAAQSQKYLGPVFPLCSLSETNNQEWWGSKESPPEWADKTRSEWIHISVVWRKGGQLHVLQHLKPQHESDTDLICTKNSMRKEEVPFLKKKNRHLQSLVR